MTCYMVLARDRDRTAYGVNKIYILQFAYLQLYENEAKIIYSYGYILFLSYLLVTLLLYFIFL